MALAVVDMPTFDFCVENLRGSFKKKMISDLLKMKAERRI